MYELNTIIVYCSKCMILIKHDVSFLLVENFHKTLIRLLKCLRNGMRLGAIKLMYVKQHLGYQILHTGLVAFSLMQSGIYRNFCTSGMLICNWQNKLWSHLAKCFS